MPSFDCCCSLLKQLDKEIFDSHHSASRLHHTSLQRAPPASRAFSRGRHVCAALSSPASLPHTSNWRLVCTRGSESLLTSTHALCPCLSSAPEDVFQLARVYYLTKQYHRAAYLLASRGCTEVGTLSSRICWLPRPFDAAHAFDVLLLFISSARSLRVCNHPHWLWRERCAHVK